MRQKSNLLPSNLIFLIELPPTRKPNTNEQITVEQVRNQMQQLFRRLENSLAKVHYILRGLFCME